MTASNELLCFQVRPLRETAMARRCNFLRDALPYAQYVVRSFPLRRVTVLHPAQMF